MAYTLDEEQMRIDGCCFKYQDRDIWVTVNKDLVEDFGSIWDIDWIDPKYLDGENISVSLGISADPNEQPRLYISCDVLTPARILLTDSEIHRVCSTYESVRGINIEAAIQWIVSDAIAEMVEPCIEFVNEPAVAPIGV